MGIITITVPTAGSPRTAASVANPLNTIKNEINGNLDNNNVKEGANIGWSKIAKIGSTVADIADTTISSVAAGDILHRNGSSKWVNLAIGASGTFLKSTGSAPSWTTIALDDLSDVVISSATAGDRLRHDGSTFKNQNALKENTDGATVTFDLDVSNFHQLTLGGNRTLAVTNDEVGDKFVVRLKQDATGSRTVTWWSGISWAGGSAPTLTTTASKADLIGFVKTASGAYDGFVIAQNI